MLNSLQTLVFKFLFGSGFLIHLDICGKIMLFQGSVQMNCSICLILITSILLADLPQSYTKDVQDFVKNLYSVGQTALQNKGTSWDDHHKDGDKSEKHTLNPFTLTIQSNVACIELLLWAIREETGNSYVPSFQQHLIIYAYQLTIADL